MTQIKCSFPAALRGALLGAVVAFSSAAAEEIPEEMLMLDYAKCMQGCLEAVGQNSCEVLCGCSMSRFQSDLDLAAYTELFSQLSRNEISPENREYLNETELLCYAELDQLIEKSLLERPDLTTLPPPEEEG